jgi:hypothetical protein
MPYRDELEALRAREAQLANELTEARRLRIACEHRSLPVLENLRVASPCPAKWEDMIGDESVRFCGACAKNVYDLSAMTRDEAQAFVASRTEPVCVTFRRRADGRVLTSDCPVGVRRRRRFGLGVVAFAAVAVASALAVRSVVEPPSAAEPCAARAKGERPDLGPRRAEPRAKSLETPDQKAAYTPYVTTGALAAPKTRESRLTGCLCAPGDPLCSCL